MKKSLAILIMCGLFFAPSAIAMSSLRNRLATNWIALKNAASNVWGSTVKTYTPKISSPASWSSNPFSRTYSTPRFPSPNSTTSMPLTTRWSRLPVSPSANLDTRTFATSSPSSTPFWKRFFGPKRSAQPVQLDNTSERTTWDETSINNEAHNIFEQIKRPQSAADQQKTLAEISQSLSQHPPIDSMYMRDEIQKLAENDATLVQHIVNGILKIPDAPYLTVYYALQAIHPFTHFYIGHGLLPKSIEKEIGTQLIRSINDRRKITTMDLATLPLRMPTYPHLYKAFVHKLLSLPRADYDVLILIETAALYANNQPSPIPYDAITQHMDTETKNAIRDVSSAHTDADIARAALTAVRKILEMHKKSTAEIERFINNQ